MPDSEYKYVKQNEYAYAYARMRMSMLTNTSMRMRMSMITNTSMRMRMSMTYGRVFFDAHKFLLVLKVSSSSSIIIIIIISSSSSHSAASVAVCLPSPPSCIFSRVRRRRAALRCMASLPEASLSACIYGFLAMAGLVRAS